MSSVALRGYKVSQNDPGNIIILNGTSSSGKSTLAKALQIQLPGVYLHTGIDHFLARLPETFFSFTEDYNAELFDGVLWVIDGQSKKLKELRIGPMGFQVIEALYKTATAVASTGLSVLVDDVLFDERQLQIVVDNLADRATWFVAVHCAKEEAMRREAERGDRSLGLVEVHYDLVHRHGKYDWEVDTSIQSLAECVSSIHQMFTEIPVPQALRHLKESLTDNAL